MSKIRRSLGRADNVGSPPVPLQPSVVSVEVPGNLIEYFTASAEEKSATVARLSSLSALDDHLTGWLGTLSLPGGGAQYIAAENHPFLEGCSQCDLRAPEPDDLVGINVAVAAVAETGSVVIASSAINSISFGFLPETNIVVVDSRTIVSFYEESWAFLPDPGRHGMPRNVNWITGPSRTADIEQEIQLGAHGPRRLHIVIIDDVTV